MVVLGNLNAAGMGEYLIQLLITDGTTTYALIPPTNEGESYELVDATEYPKMTNFRYVARGEVSRYDMDLQERPTGIERFNAMPCALEDLRFTKGYESPDFLSEFIGINETTKDSTDAELEAIYDLARAKYLTRSRNGETWQTMHSVVYGDKMEELYIQENWDDNIVSREEVVYGHLDGGNFYKGDNTIPEVPSADRLYVDKIQSVPYIWNEADGFKAIGGGGGSMPEPPADGKIYVRTRAVDEEEGEWEEAVLGATVLAALDAAKSKGMTLDFGLNEDVIQVVNVFGNLHIKKVLATNCATIRLSHGSVLQQSVTPGDVDIAILEGETMIWEITRTSDNQNAILGFKTIDDLFL